MGQRLALEDFGGPQRRRGAEVPVWLRSHPKVPERIAAIEAMEDRWGVRAAP